MAGIEGWGLRGESAWCGTRLDWQADTFKIWCFKCKTKHPLRLTTIPPFNLPPQVPRPFPGIIEEKLNKDKWSKKLTRVCKSVLSILDWHLNEHYLLVTFSNEFMFQVFSSGRRETGGGFSRTGSSSLSLLPYFDMADLASSGPYIVSILKTSSFTPQCECSIAESLFLCVNIICNLHLK